MSYLEGSLRSMSTFGNVFVNREPTPLDDGADLVIRAEIGAVLEPFIVRN